LGCVGVQSALLIMSLNHGWQSVSWSTFSARHSTLRKPNSTISLAPVIVIKLPTRVFRGRPNSTAQRLGHGMGSRALSKKSHHSLSAASVSYIMRMMGSLIPTERHDRQSIPGTRREEAFGGHLVMIDTWLEGHPPYRDSYT